MSTFWDQAFSQEEYKYGMAPNAFLVEQAAQFSAASQILLPGDGEGRNSVWLAEQGHHVTALDQSRIGLSKARALAMQRGVSIHTEQANLATWRSRPSTWDAVVLIYLHLPSQLRRRAHQQLWHGLKQGGLFVLEAFSPAQVHHTSGGPKDPDLLYDLHMLKDDLQPFEDHIEHLVGHETQTTLDEGPGHQGLAEVVRFMVRKI